MSVDDTAPHLGASARAGSPAPASAGLPGLAGATRPDRGSRSAEQTVRRLIVYILLFVLGATLMALGGFGVVLYTLLRLTFDRTEPGSELLAEALVGLLVWVYHRDVTERRSLATRQAARLVTSAAGLAAAAAGIGIIVDSALAPVGEPLVGSDLRPLLLGGISSLLIGGPVWWFSWRPRSRVSPRERGFAGRRVYLITVFGLSAVVAIITLLVIGYQGFEYALGPVVVDSLIERVRTPLGVLAATTLVAAYHLSMWRADRAALGTDAPAVARGSPD